MKKLLTVALLASGSLAFAQDSIPKKINLRNNSEFQQKSLLEDSKYQEKKEIFDLSSQGQDAKFQISGKLKGNMRSSQGSEGVGGGNGVQGSDGKITPLDMLFAQENRPIDIKKAYPAGYKYFQKQVDKIAKAIPSFAIDIESEFSSLKWIGTGLELSDLSGCLNNMGIFKVRSGEKQIVLACQNAEGEVTINLKAIKLLKNPEYLGVVLLHEAFVKSMLTVYKPEEYPQAEYQMISKVVPYIILNPTLNPEKIYEYAQVISYVRGDINKYSIEVFQDRRLAYEQELAAHENDLEQMKALKDQQRKLELMVQKLLQTNFNLCDGTGSIIVAYSEVFDAHRRFTVQARKFAESASRVYIKASAFVMASDVDDALMRLKRGYDSTMGYDKIGYGEAGYHEVRRGACEKP